MWIEKTDQTGRGMPTLSIRWKYARLLLCTGPYIFIGPVKQKKNQFKRVFWVLIETVLLSTHNIRYG